MSPLSSAVAPRARSAFTLVEVMVALAIFAMAAIVLGASYVNVLMGYAMVNRAPHADADLYFVKAALHAEADREAAEEGDEFESTNGRRVRWSTVITPLNVADLFEVTLTCELTDAGETQPRVVTQTLRLLRPTWSQAEEREALRTEARERIIEFQESRR